MLLTRHRTCCNGYLQQEERFDTAVMVVPVYVYKHKIIYNKYITLAYQSQQHEFW